MEAEKVVHMCHEHPLGRILLESARQTEYSIVCYGCERFFRAGDVTYGCSIMCGFVWLLHKECMEMPRQIMHPIHPSHHLSLAISESDNCAACGGYLRNLAYRCSQGECDGLWIHLGCAGGLNDKQPLMAHPSHPQHELHFSNKTRWCPFHCDACGATEQGDSYTCSFCNYWIHERCALLPLSADFPRHHPAHKLSLAFSLPSEYIRYDFDCDICCMTLPLRRWLYHCHLCRYVVHLNCAFDNQNESDDDEKEATKFPIAVEDMYEEMIRPFVKRQKEQILVPHHDHDNHNIGGKYRFSNHPHHLLTFNTFSSSSSSYDHHEKNDDDDDEDDFESITRSDIICDGCTLAIHEKKQTNDDDDEYESGYMSCDECKYFLHLSCFNLPPEILNHPFHLFNDHNLRLQNVDGKLTGWIQCRNCNAYTNGLYYACTYKGRWFKIDIKCASLPNTIKHASHPQHNYLKPVTEDDFRPGLCDNCHMPSYFRKEQYRCNRCMFSVCGRCVMLPATNKHRQENHLLTLAYDARANRPGDFYCSSCEGQMHPRRWMYHCQDCDQSFDPDCFPATSSDYRNIKYGTQYVISNIHDHHLRFKIITKKMRCDLCHRYCYDWPGFQCVSCFFAVCKACGIKHVMG